MTTHFEEPSRKTNTSEKSRRWSYLAGLILVVLTLALRLPHLNLFVTWDEPAWASRSFRFLLALEQGNFGETILSGHPGVTTMYSGALGIAVARQWDRGPTVESLEYHLKPDFLDDEVVRHMAAELPAARIPAVLLNAALVLAVFAVSQRLLGTGPAFLAGLLLAIDPFYIGLSRVLHTDALAAAFMLLSVLWLLRWQETASRRTLMASGFAAGLAIITKGYAIYLLGFVGLLILATGLVRNTDTDKFIKQVLRVGALWISGLFAGLLLWPAMWVDPLRALHIVIFTALGYAQEPEDTSRLLAVEGMDEASLWFYAVSVIFRTTPLAMLGFLLALAGLYRHRFADPASSPSLKRKTSERQPYLWLLVYALLFLIVLSAGAKKFDRYALPSLLALNVIAAWGLWWITDSVLAWSRHTRRVWSVLLTVLVVAALFAAQTAHAVAHHPYYLAYYNPVVGGLPRATQTIPVGWGEGLDQVADYLNDQADASQRFVGSWQVAGLAPLFEGSVVPPTEENTPLADFLLVYVSDRQEDSPWVQELLDTQVPEFVARIQGLEYARLYRNPHFDIPELTQFLENHLSPADRLLLSQPLAWSREAGTEFTPHAAPTNEATELALWLTETTQNTDQVWLFQTTDADQPRDRWTRRLADTGLCFVASHDLDIGSLRQYTAADPLRFRRAEIETPAQYRFQETIELTGYGVTAHEFDLQQALGVALGWRKLQADETDWHISLRLVDADERTWLQYDTALHDLNGHLTSTWSEAQLTESYALLKPTADVPPAWYQLVVILYTWPDPHPVEVTGPGLEPYTFEARLGWVEVTNQFCS